MTPHFTLAEFTYSENARRAGLDNSIIGDQLMANAIATLAMAERVRAHLSMVAGEDIPVVTTSGYRCVQVNKMAGSRDTSDHVLAMALDFKAPKFGTPLAICRALVPVLDKLGIGQIVYEFDWVHISTRAPDKIVNRIITVQGKGYVVGINATR